MVFFFIRGTGCSHLLSLNLKVLTDTALKPQRREWEIPGVHFLCVLLKVHVQEFELEISQEFPEDRKIFLSMGQIILERTTVLRKRQILRHAVRKAPL